MSEPTMTGDTNGVNLWNRMATTKDELEASYTRSVQNAAQKYGKVWFSDSVAQRYTGANQPMYQMTWDPNAYQWIVTLFLTPETTPISPPKVKYDEVEIEVDDVGWEEISADDIIII